ncbi:adenosylcobinamide-GDP ribazoletransferase [Actinocatenispora rupis]|uniref:Adenosylcobinamide-GDP ribazoletransferase n=1 Tax=Actinocatenispora rupis TaxID=519421 RepID=A0A8J3J3X5_9ACTN|nr:adenosylcobinamide-GDP ribazoletransferase [Actinocatenispora rupis]GID09687.1 adenosylcobinamide-GDP ribazoletransferase [Actinocatenispora rupis]
MRDGLRLALTTFTVLPVRAGRIDRSTARTAMVLAPVVGVALGALLAGLALLLRLAGAPAPLAGVAVVAAAVLATRALHLDGLADTVDAFGSYADADRALAIMKRSDIGPFGVVALLLVLGAQVAALTAVLPRPPLAVLATLTVAAGTGRLAVTLACRRGVPAARPDGLGALVAGTVPGWVVAPAAVLLAAAGGAADPGRRWLGPVAVAAGVAVAYAVTRRATRRFGGITGDTLGAALELAGTVTLAVLAC